jgi:hypothetical protein
VGCKSSPYIIEYYVSDDVRQYYFPYTTWKTDKTNNIRVRLDITHRTEIGWDIVCNISFINRKVIPQYVSTIAFYADEVFYQLKDVKLFLLDREINAYRITSNISFKNFLSICRSDSIVLIAAIDNEDYHFDAPDEFYIYSDQYIKYLSINDSY